jgi:DNA-binding transcriptional MerR regulator
MDNLQIGEVARRTGLTVDAIRFYEKSGLLPHPARSMSGYRLYRASALEDLAFIQKAQRLGFSLDEIRQLFAIQRHPREVCSHVRDLIAQKLSTVRKKIEELRSLEAGLSDALKRCQRTMRPTTRHSGICPVLKEIAAQRPGPHT